MDADGGESETSRVDTSEPEVHTHSRRGAENQGRPHGIISEGRKGDDMAEVLEPGMGQERAISTPPQGGSERRNVMFGGVDDVIRKGDSSSPAWGITNGTVRKKGPRK
ncbi:hypothetical protein NDU88_010740 [Pleurodeles waltl]|uniref:Uncharacterized protein n=1 Tax=Pleurodeles waltl TaxID=8319 RepID=A0AAV7QV82_PLEWA|nr:hypothetical protein NDU88_010740 [Pleurodeles waltl]